MKNRAASAYTVTSDVTTSFACIAEGRKDLHQTSSKKKHKKKTRRRTTWFQIGWTSEVFPTLPVKSNVFGSWRS